MVLQVNTVKNKPSRDNIAIIKRWIGKDIVYNKRVLRLRACIYLKIHWIETSHIWDNLMLDADCYPCTDNKQWITLKRYMDVTGRLLPRCEEEYQRKLEVFQRWDAITQECSYFAEEVFKKAFEEAGYDVKRNQLLSDATGQKHQIDLYCVKGDWTLGAQVKNNTSDVFHDPHITKNFTQIYLDLDRQFNFCSSNGIIPVFIAPFINKTFYNFAELYQGLYCQTFSQLIKPEYAETVSAVKNVLRFGNLVATDTAPRRVTRWIDKIPEMWEKHYSKSTV